MGHVRAAEAIESAVREVAPAVTVQNVDVLGLTNAAFRRAYRDSYLALINHAPWLFGYFYDLFDRPTPPAWAADRLRLAVEQFNLSRLRRVVEGTPWDVVVAEVLARGAVMAVVYPVPGHEARNSDYVLEHGAGVKVNSLGTLAWKLTGLLRSPERLARLKRHARHAARPRAAFAIARLALTVGSAALHGSRPTAGPSDRDARPDVPPSPRRARR